MKYGIIACIIVIAAFASCGEFLKFRANNFEAALHSESWPTPKHRRNLKARISALKRWRTMRGVVWPARRKPGRILLKGLPFWPARLRKDAAGKGESR